VKITFKEVRLVNLYKQVDLLNNLLHKTFYPPSDEGIMWFGTNKMV